jgi:hypothetical protein
VVDPGSYLTWTCIVPPAGRVAGSAPAFTVKALLELVSCATCTEEVPEFSIVRVRNTGVPMFTSPKSIVAGLICRPTAAELVVENGLEFEPQPDRAPLSAMVATLKAIALRAIFPRNLLVVGVPLARLADISSLIAKNKELRNSHIDITCPKRISQPMRITRLAKSGEIIVDDASVD